MNQTNVLILCALSIVILGAAIFYHTYNESRDRDENRDNDRYSMSGEIGSNAVLDKKTGNVWYICSEKYHGKLQVIPIKITDGNIQ